jgi:uncharacterized paraquat-inducible protein A
MHAKILNITALLLILISFGLLIPGIFLPVLTIKGKLIMPLIGNIELGTETRSILGTVEYLWDTENYLVSCLIFIFSVTVPFVKGILLLFVLFPGSSRVKSVLLTVIRRIGKWSMADVFVVGIFLAYLASASMQVFQATLEKGFYFFLGYCLISVLATEFIVLKSK